VQTLNGAGRKFVTAIETDESALLSAARTKALIGGHPITARLLYRGLFTFILEAKFWLAFNHRPLVADDSHGFWRRVHLIPFNCKFDPAPKQTSPTYYVPKRRASWPGLSVAVSNCSSTDLAGPRAC
jgi:phage/plasmid-associated DNA primase